MKQKFRKKPVVIEAIQFTDANKDQVYNDVLQWQQNIGHGFESGQPVLKIPTLEGTMTANINDWIIKGVNGEVYPCKPEIFEKTYESAAGSQVSAEVKEELWEPNEKELLESLLRLYKDWCKETKRNGGVLIGKSITEFIEHVAKKFSTPKEEKEEWIKENPPESTPVILLQKPYGDDTLCHYIAFFEEGKWYDHHSESEIDSKYNLGWLPVSALPAPPKQAE